MRRAYAGQCEPCHVGIRRADHGCLTRSINTASEGRSARAGVAAYLASDGGHALITSRNPAWYDLATPVEVGVFARTESIELLRRRAPRLNQGEAGRIAEALGDLPLALAQAGAHLADTAASVEDYLTLLAERATELLAQGAPATYPLSLAASVQIALDRLTTHSPAALQLLTLAAYLAPEPIPLALFTAHPAHLPEPVATAAADPLAFTELARLLRQHGLARGRAAACRDPRRPVGQPTGLAGLAPAPAACPHRHRPAPHPRAWLLDRAGSYLHTRGSLLT